MPTMRPTMAPKQRDGMNSPHGTLIPNVKTVMVSLRISAKMSNHSARWTPGPAAAISIAELTSVKLRL